MWNNITGQKSVIEKLKSVYKSRRVAHAYLFHGSDGTGKDAAAIEFAKLLNCKNIQNGDEACDICVNCKKVASLKSEYLQIICALPAGKSEQTDSEPLEKLDKEDFESYMEQLTLKSQNPYHHISLSNANNIRINSIRQLVSKIYLSASSDTRKVFLISEADKMKQEAANALLKVLEEPPKNSVIILTTSKINSLLQTIIGRCQKIYFEPLAQAQIKDKLNKTQEHLLGNFTSQEIDIASSLSDGSYTKAVELLEMGVDDIRNSAVDYLIALLKDDYANIVLISRNITSKNNRDRAKYFLFILNMWFRDLLKVKYSDIKINDSPNGLSNYDLTGRLLNFNNNYPDADIYRIIIELEEAEKLINQNAQLLLIILTLAFKLKNLLKK
jgi:DNA polymerase-3 subunit delta'